MTSDRVVSPEPGARPGELPAAVADRARRGRRLCEAPVAERDLRWSIQAYMLGDLGALSSGVIRSGARPLSELAA